MDKLETCGACNNADACGRHDSLKKWFVYQSTEKHDELKAACFQGVEKEGKEAGDSRFFALGAV